MKTCSVEDCQRTDIKVRNLCVMHYGRFLRHGDPTAGGTRATGGPRHSLATHSVDDGDCRVWTGARVANGYGQIRVDGALRLAHRVAYELEHGPLGAGLVVDHTCHNRACIRLEHLRAVTQKQNLENNGVHNKRNKSGVRGVHWSARTERWIAQVCHNYRSYHVGSFKSLAEAEAAVIAKRNELFTHNDLDRMAAA